MKAFLYKVEVFDGDVAYIHSIPKTIKEVYIPELKLVFNEDGGLFQSESPRNVKNFYQIKIPERIANDLLECFKSLEYKNYIIKNIFQ